MVKTDIPPVIRNSKSRIQGSKKDLTAGSTCLQEWIKAALESGAVIVWERSDCDLKSDYPEPKEGYPICVVIRIDWKAERIGMKIHFLANSTRGN